MEPFVNDVYGGTESLQLRFSYVRSQLGARPE
jgi:hypothetical protein